MTLRAVIFDVDGTLGETEEAHRAAFNEAFAACGLDWNWDRTLYAELLQVAGGRERMRHYIETRHPEVAARRDFEAWLGELHRDKTARVNARLSSGAVRLRPGIARLLRQVHADADVRLAIATTTRRANVEALLAVNLGPDAPRWVDAYGTGDSVQTKKPAPDVYLWVAEALGLAPDACLAIEDSAVGLAAASAAGVPAVVTVSTYTRDDDFTGALAVLDTLGEPDALDRRLAGDVPDSGMVDLDTLRDWHDAAR